MAHGLQKSTSLNRLFGTELQGADFDQGSLKTVQFFDDLNKFLR